MSLLTYCRTYDVLFSDIRWLRSLQCKLGVYFNLVSYSVSVASFVLTDYTVDRFIAIMHPQESIYSLFHPMKITMITRRVRTRRFHLANLGLTNWNLCSVYMNFHKLTISKHCWRFLNLFWLFPNIFENFWRYRCFDGFLKLCCRTNSQTRKRNEYYMLLGLINKYSRFKSRREKLVSTREMDIFDPQAWD